jgi:hypothetical protein
MVRIQENIMLADNLFLIFFSFYNFFGTVQLKLMESKQKIISLNLNSSDNRVIINES